MKNICFSQMLFLWLLLVSSSGICQEVPIGTPRPDAPFRLLSNDSVYTHLSAFAGKWVVLDFWNTYCKGCIEKLAVYDSLQKQFDERWVILPVTDQKEEVIRKFWATNKITKGLQISTAVEDRLLHRYFPHRTVPHLVWISPSGVVVAITDAEYLSTETMSAALQGLPMSFPIKKDMLLTELDQPLLTANPSYGPDMRPLAYSAVLPYQPGAAKTFDLKFDTTGSQVRIWAINQTAFELYRSTLAEKDWQSYRNRVVLEGIDSSQLFVQKSRKHYQHDWLNAYNFCYESVVPLGMRKQTVYEDLRANLNRWLPIKGRIEKRKVPCFVLKRTTMTEKYLKATHALPIYRLALLMNNLNRLDIGIPVVDETGIDGTRQAFASRLVLPVHAKDIHELNIVLQSIGLMLEKAHREMEVLILSNRASVL